MRTAITIGKSHEGKWSIISDPSASIVEQIAAFRGFKLLESNDEFAEVRFQEDDDSSVSIHFLTSAQLEAKKASHKEDMDKLFKSIEERSKPKPLPAPLPKPEITVQSDGTVILPPHPTVETESKPAADSEPVSPKRKLTK
jgi:hypothetical protein